MTEKMTNHFYFKHRFLIGLLPLFVSACALLTPTDVAETQETLQLRLFHPLTQKPMPHTAYRLVLENGRIVSTEGFAEKISEQVLHGKTDAKGMTAQLTILKKGASATRLTELVGAGAFGTSFIMHTKEGVPWQAYHYRAKLCDGKTYQGYTNDMGETAYFLSEASCTLAISPAAPPASKKKSVPPQKTSQTKSRPPQKARAKPSIKSMNKILIKH